MVRSPTTTDRRAAVLLLLVAALGLVVVGLDQGAASATVQATGGSAFGYNATLQFFGGETQVFGPTPTVTLPSGGSAAPITATDDGGRVQVSAPAGPTIFSSGPITVSTQGTTGASGSVTSSSTITGLNQSGNEGLDAATVSSTCSASEFSRLGATTVTGGFVVTDENTDEADPVPTNPEPGFSIEGVNGAGSRYRYIFNEQIYDGTFRTITVNAVRLEPLTGPLSGSLIIGQVVCGVIAGEEPTTTTAPTGGSTSTTIGTTSTTTGGTTSTTAVVTDRLCRGRVPTIVGAPGNDNIDGTSGDDVIVGLSGNDRIRGLGGNDVICGGAGDDRLVGGSGADILSGGLGNDHIVGDAGQDRLIGDEGDDALRGGPGDDELDGRDGTDDCRTGLGVDTRDSCETGD